MDTRRQKEGDEGSGVFVDFHGGYGGVVDVAEEKDVYGAVPISCELIPGNYVAC